MHGTSSQLLYGGNLVSLSLGTGPESRSPSALEVLISLHRWVSNGSRMRCEVLRSLRDRCVETRVTVLYVPGDGT